MFVWRAVEVEQTTISTQIPINLFVYVALFVVVVIYANKPDEKLWL